MNATAIGRAPSGIARYATSLLRQLLGCGADLQVFVTAQAPCWLRSEPRSRVNVVWGGVSPDLGFGGHLLRLLWTNRLRLAHGRGVLFNVSPLEGCFFGTGQVLTVHDLIPLEFPSQHRRQYPFFRYLLPRILRHTSRVIAVSHFTKRRVVEQYGFPGDRVHVVHHGVADTFLGHGDEGVRQDFILYVGRWVPTKNVARLARALALLGGRHGLAPELRVVGPGRPAGPAGKGQIRFVGPVPDDELARLYRTAKLLVLPSLCEGFGFPALEAMASGCPVVATGSGALPEVCGEAACYVDGHSVESLAGGIRRVLTDGDLRRDLVERGHERAHEFRWDAAARQHLAVFEQACRETAAGG